MRIADPGAILVARQLYESLTRWDPVRQEVVPAAAASWEASRGGRRFTFKLRPGMAFHDGSPVRAESFSAAFDRIALKRNASDLAYALASIKGFAAVNGSGRRSHLRGIKTPDRDTIVFHLVRPNHAFPAVLTHPGLVPLPEAVLRRPRRFSTRPVGNGPYQVVGEWEASGPLVLRAFDRAPLAPRVPSIRFVPFPDATVSWFPFTEGELDVAEVPVGKAAVARRRYGARGYVPLAAGLYLGLRLDRGPLQNRDLRAAISRAIDRRALARQVFHGGLLVPRGIVPWGMRGFSRRACRLCVHRPRVARRLISSVPEEARRVTLNFDANRLQRRIARRVGEDLESVGLRVTLRSWPIDRYLRRLAAGRLPAYRFGWIAEFPSPEVFLSTLFASNSPDNHSGFSSREVDRLLARARREPREGARLALLRQAERLILSDVPVVPLGSFRMRWAMQRRVRGIRFDAMGGFDAASIRLANG